MNDYIELKTKEIDGLPHWVNFTLKQDCNMKRQVLKGFIIETNKLINEYVFYIV